VSGRRSREQSLRLLGRAVHDLRKQQGLTVEALAAASGLHRTQITAIETGRLDPGYSRLLHLAAGLGVRPIALLLYIEELDAHDSA
jgi:transcriptional regulator with XRE-family HTH domain